MGRPRTRPQDQGPTVADLFDNLASNLRKQAISPNILAYKPHKKQELFHASLDYLRLYLGGNRSGKTFGAVVEDIWWASKTHPYRTLPEGPIRGRVVAVDIERGVMQIILPIFKQLIAPSMLVNGKWEDSWHENKRLLTFENGSFIEFMSYEQDTEKFAGTSRHFIHYDEEPPQDIFNECQARLIDTEGSSWISMTPVEGATWVFYDIYEQVIEAKDKIVIQKAEPNIAPVTRSPSRHTSVIEVGMNENPHISAEARERYLATLTPDERSARSKGTFITIGGKVFPNFSDTTHVIEANVDPAELQKLGWQVYTSTDHGWNCPTAWLWHIVAPMSMGGMVLTFAEHYASEMTIDQHARAVNLKEQSMGLNVDEIIRVGDPAMHQHNAVTGTTIIQEYATQGLYISTESVPKDPAIGIARMQMYFRPRGGTEEKPGIPTWRVMVTCKNFIWELKRLKWKQHSSKKIRDSSNKQETVHKKDDHAFDSAKYFATFLQTLQPDDPLPQVPDLYRPSGMLSYDEALMMQIRGAQQSEASQQWTTLVTMS